MSEEQKLAPLAPPAPRTPASSPGQAKEKSIARAQELMERARDLLARAHAAFAHLRQLRNQTPEITQWNQASHDYQAEHPGQHAPAAARLTGDLPRSAEPLAAMPRHILLVEDNATLRLLLAGFLEEEGFQVTHAADGHAALAVLQTVVPDLLLTDYYMPRLDGLGLLRAVRQHWPSLPVVFCTAEAELEQTVRGYEEVSFLRKPYKLEEVLQHIERAVKW